MSSSPQKRSASEAQLSNRPTKSARTNMSRTDSEPEANARVSQEQGLAAKWMQIGRLGIGTVFAIGDAVTSTASAALNYIIPVQWKATSAFRDTDELSLPTHSLTSRQLPSPPSQTLNTSEPPNPSPMQLPMHPNHAPTNILASTSTSTSTYSFRPPQSLPHSPSSASSSAYLSRISTSGSSTTQTSLPGSPPTSKSAYVSVQTDSIRRMIAQTNSDGLLGSGVGKKYKRRSHIHERQHREHVKEVLERQLYDITRAIGYQSDFETFRSYVQYRRRLEEVQRIDSRRSHISSRTPTPILPQDEVEFFQRAVEKATKSLHSPKPPKPYSPTLEELAARSKSKNERIQNRLHPKRRPIPERLPSDALKEVNVLMRKRGVVSKAGREQVNDRDLSRLVPGQWLNDEIINFYGQLIVDRAAEVEAAKENKNGKSLDVHYFSTFFWSKLQSGYEKGRLAKWTKKVDIFAKDIILMAVNHGNAHWTSAAIDFRRKRIISYDSMGFHRSDVYKALRSYLNEEHKNKKKKPFDFTGWEDHRLETYPEQENSYDCGVFTCQTLEYLSRGEEEFNFSQKNMPYLRQRMIWEIGRAKLGDPL